MEDIPQPATDPYAPGDHVRVYLSESDTDSKYHGLVCEIIADVPDGLGAETGDALIATDTNSAVLIQTPRFRCGFAIATSCQLPKTGSPQSSVNR